MKLDKDQSAAAQYLTGPELVLAGPGTGKTQLLSGKVEYILRNTDADPSTILCLTYTEAGAQNMRDRLQSTIGQAALGVNIHTYHAFGKTLLDRYVNYNPDVARVMDNAVDDIMKYQIAARILEKIPPYRAIHRNSISDILGTISKVKAARLTADDLKLIHDTNAADSEEISAAASPILQAAAPRAKLPKAWPDTYEPLLAALEALQDETKIAGHIEHLIMPLLRDYRRVIEKAQNENSVSPLTKWRNSTFELDAAGNYRLKNVVSQQKLSDLATLMDAYEQYLRDHDLYDFDDMILQAIKYLKEDEGFRLTLREQFQYILLDEFQDTNASQFELVSLLIDPENTFVMAVGDDDQAICAFQGANASNLTDFQTSLGAKVFSLTTNYRSFGDILALSRKVADQISDSFVKSNPDLTKTLTSFKDSTLAASRASEISRHEFPNSAAEYTWVAGQIRALLDAGEDPSEIAIIAPKHAFLVETLPFLKAQNIPISYERRENLLEYDSLRELITVAKFINDLSEGKPAAHHLPDLLSFPFWGLDLLKVASLFTNRFSSQSALEYLNTPDFENLARFFAALAAKAKTTPLELWLDYLIGTTPLDGFTSPYLSYYTEHFTQAELLEFYENLATFRETVLTHALSLGQNSPTFVPHLADFVSTITDYETAGIGIQRTSLFQSDTRAVAVMTAHHSKGLEFKHVFLTACDDDNWGTRQGNRDPLSLPLNLHPIRNNNGSDDERLRLLFVAITRAKERLTMTNSQQSLQGDKLGRIAYLSESSPEADAPISPYLPESRQDIILHTNDLDTPAKIEALKLSWGARYQKLTPALRPLLLERASHLRLTATLLTSFIYLTYAGPISVYEQTLLQAPNAPTEPHLIYGNLAHKVFEEVTRAKLSDTDALNRFLELVPTTTLDEAEQETLRLSGEHNLAIALEKFGDLLRTPGAQAEVNLSSEALSFANIPITGKIDHLHINEADKTIEVYDFKTSSFHKSGWDAHPSNLSYRLQLGFYKLLLNSSPTYRKYTVTKGHILYITPDKTDTVYDKVYEFNPADEKQLQDLVCAVYYQLTSLAFLDDPELFIPADKSNTAPVIRDFIDLLISKTPKSVS